MEYLHRQIVKATGARSTTLLQWVERGLVWPENPHPGRGGSRRWTLDDALMIYTLVQLTRMGLEARAAAEGARVVAREASRYVAYEDPDVAVFGEYQEDAPIYLWRGVDGEWASSASLGIPGAPQYPALVFSPRQIAETVIQNLEEI